MSKSHITPEKLIATGSIVPELHYGPNLRDCPFVVCIIRNVHSSLQPRYICKGIGQSSGINTSASAVITSVYQSVFGSKTKYAGLSYLGVDQPETAQKLLEGVIFCLFIIELENIIVFVSCL
ncbi:2110_t:CDS:2, partial [Funneliformis geosporum]